MWSTIASWAALLVLGAALTLHYNPGLLKKLLPQQQPGESGLIHEAPRNVNLKKHKTKRTHTHRVDVAEESQSPISSSNEAKQNKKRKIVSGAASMPVKTSLTQDHISQEEEDSISTKAFAQQLAKAQHGTNLTRVEKNGTSKQGQRTVKTTPKLMQNGFEQTGILTDTSSTGREGDDDFSPDASPASRPISTAPTSRFGDVSDMLEAPAPKPTTLRLTDISDSKSTPKIAPKYAEQSLSKKQRQRQAKQAEQKALREESDRIHEAKKQAQLRAARTAAGTSNQTKANAFAATQNPWQNDQAKQTKPSPESTGINPVPLLDTFDSPMTPKAVTNSVSSGALSNTTNRLTNGDNTPKAGEKLVRSSLPSRDSWADQVDEDEQNKWADKLVEEEQWEPVTTKRSKKKSKRDGDTSSEASSSFTKPVSTIKSSTNGIHTHEAQSRPVNINRFQSMEAIRDTDLRDAEWEA